MRRGVAAAFAFAALLAAAGCAEKSEDEQVEETIRDFARATSEADGEELCEEIYTREFLELAWGGTGDDAVDQCVKETERAPGNPVEVIEIGAIRVRDERATVTVRLRTRTGEQRQQLRLRKEDGEFRLDAN